MNKKQQLRRRIRIRKKIRGTKDVPRLTVFKSNRYLYVQLINDEKGETLAGASQKDLGKTLGVKRMELAKQIGIFLAKKGIEKKIKKVVFDRSGHAYHGIIKAIADGAREGGLKF